MSDEILNQKIKETHSSEWVKFSGLQSLISIALPILSEFEGVGSHVFMLLGGTAAVSVFSILMKIARVTCAVQGIYSEQDEINAKDREKDVEKIMARRKRRAESKYLPDPIEWLEGIEEEISEELEKKYDIT